MFGIRKTLQFGSAIFGFSAVLLLFAPSVFLDLLGLDSTDRSLIWSMRMIAITLVALAGNMWLHARLSSEDSIKRVGAVMAVAATALGVLTVLLPGEHTWFSAMYAAVGFLFGLNYAVCLWRKLM